MTSLVESTYVDAFGDRRRIEPEVHRAVMQTMGIEPGQTPPAGAGVHIVRPGGRLPLAGTVELEDGTDLGACARLPRDVPFGYHHLHHAAGTALLLTGPGRCHLPAGLHAWGWAIQLASVRSRDSWGIGDLGDLRRLAVWSAAQGAGFIAVSPLGAANPGPDPEPSPYYPSTRRFGSPLHLDVPSAARDAGPGREAIGDLAQRGRALNDLPLVDRAAVLAVKREALERLWASGAIDRGALAAWRAERGEALDRWGAFNVLTERNGPGWQSWPAAERDPRGAAVDRIGAEQSDRLAFHAWVQQTFDGQLAEASEPLARIADMPVGVDPGGFDAWDWQEQLALGASVGAPPDRFNRDGQDWGLPPFVPHRLRAAGYRPFIDTIRAQLRRAGGLRIDHVLGLFRQWWIPRGDSPERGAYVRFPTDELLEIVAIESQRAQAVVIGEDLGTVPAGVRRELRRRGVLSTRLAMFERLRPERYPRQAFAAVTTHDLPTLAGTVGGADLADQRAAGMDADAGALALLRRRLLRAAGMPPTGGPADALAVELHRRLAASPSMLVAASLEDAVLAERRPNLPGTVAEQRPNWSIPLPLPLEELTADRRVARIVAALQR